MATVNTVNPASGAGQNGLSNVINFIINNPPNPAPTITNVSPNCVVAGNSLALTITGTNFLSGPSNTTPPQVSTVTWTLGATSTPFTNPPATITSTQITVTIPAANIAATGTAGVTVSNPPSLPVTGIPGSLGSGGGTTPATSVIVQNAACPAAAKGTASTSAEALAIAEETPAISGDGRYVAYTAVQDGHSQIFFRDTCENAVGGCQPATNMLSVSGDGSTAAGESRAPSMSSNGRYVAFSSDAADLVENAPPGRQGRRILQASNGSHFHGSRWRSRRNREHPSIGQLVGAFRRISGRDAEPRINWRVSRIKIVVKPHQQWLPAGLRSRYLPWGDQLHSQNNPHLPSTRRWIHDSREARWSGFGGQRRERGHRWRKYRHTLYALFDGGRQRLPGHHQREALTICGVENEKGTS
jgi:hypothetical protein